MNCVYLEKKHLIQLKNAFKMFEGRLYRGTIKNLSINDRIYIRYKEELLLAKIINLYIFNNFKDMLLKDETTLNKTLPYVNSLDEGVELYNSIYKKYNINNYKVILIQIEIIYD